MFINRQPLMGGEVEVSVPRRESVHDVSAGSMMARHSPKPIRAKPSLAQQALHLSAM
jgi:hypothetical protein